MRKATLLLEGKSRVALQQVYEEDRILKAEIRTISHENKAPKDSLKQELISKCVILSTHGPLLETASMTKDAEVDGADVHERERGGGQQDAGDDRTDDG